ncbi:hypothetical protein GQR58_025778 [Nymphon striatum]|nr:hypothetical protein GQR58_025778 [Nymphon striatum]
MVLLPYDEYLDKYDEKVREPIAPYDPKNVDYSKKFKKIKQENLPPDIEYKLTSGVISSLAKGNNNKPVARSLSDDVILLSIPPVYINRGRNLLLFLKQNGFKWDSLGLITEPITGGNIVDILKHVVIKTKKNKTPPDGWNAYANYMREAPTDFRPDATTPSEINLRGRWISRFKRKLVLEWMEKQPSYTLHRQVKKRYKTSQVKVPGINHQFQADLMDVSNLSKYNDNYKFILTVIDCFSRLHVTYKMDPIFEAYRQPSLQLGGGYIPVYQGGAGVLSDIWRFTKPIIHRLARPALGLAADILVKKKSPKAALKRTLINETIQEKSVVVDIHPISAQSGSAPIEFFIPGDGQYYIDLNDTILALDVKLNKPVATEKTAPVNQLISSLFSNLELTLNDTQVEGGSHLYSYKSYFNTLLQYGKDAKETHLRNYGFYKDEPKKFDDITGDGNAKRLAYQGKTMYLNGAIFADIFHQPRYLLPHVNVRLRFTRQPEKFSLVNFTDTVIETNITITKAIMYVRKVRVSPSVGLAHEEGRVPKAIYIGLVTNDAFAGSIKHNPFNFRHFNCNFAQLTLDGENIQQPFSPNFKTHDCAREYMSLYHSLNLFRTNGSCGITIDDFKDGNTIFGFNLCPDQVITGYAQPRNYGQLKLELKFMESLPKTINVIMFAIFDGNIEITKERNVIIN